MPNRRLLACSVAFFGLLASARLMAEPASALRVYEGLQLGMDAQDVRDLLLSRGMLVKRKSFKTDEGLSFGLLGQPQLLPLLNRYKVRHRLLEDLPESGPLFMQASTDLTTSVFGFVDRKLETYAFTLPAEQLLSASSPFSAERLAPFRDTLGALQERCRYFTPLDRDRHGNVYSWSGERCSGGELKVEYSPGSEQMMRVLVHP